MPSAVIIDDDDLFRESLSHNLNDIDFDVADFSNGEEAVRHLVDIQERPDIVLLDWKMPEMNGIEVLKAIRDAKIDVPVIFLTVLGEQIYEEAALTGGAVDFIEKSRSFTILRRRIELVLSRRRQANLEDQEAGIAEELQIGELTLKPRSFLVYWQDHEMEFSVTEYRMIEVLASRAGDYATYRELYDVVHGQDFRSGYGAEGFRANVRTFIKRIRAKFKDVDSNFDRIENYPSVGYRWTKDD